MNPINLPIQYGDDLSEIPIKKSGKNYFVEYYDYVSAGFPSPASDFEGDRISLDEKYIKEGSTYLLRTGGVSMFPTFLVDDKLICHSGIDIFDEAPVIVSVNNSLFTFKRYYADLNMFIPDNPAFPSIKIEDGDVVILKGIVVAMLRDKLHKFELPTEHIL